MKLKEAYKFMLCELISNHLEVILVPSKFEDIAKDGGKIRVVVSQNADWYRQLCSKYCIKNNRKNKRTIINRKNIESILTRLSNGKSTKSKYHNDLKEFAEDYIERFDFSADELNFIELYGELPVDWNEQF